MRILILILVFLFVANALNAQKTDREGNENSPGFRIAYRLQGNKGITLRATAIVFFNLDPVLIPTIGIGYSFW